MTFLKAASALNSSRQKVTTHIIQRFLLNFIIHFAPAKERIHSTLRITQNTKSEEMKAGINDWKAEAEERKQTHRHQQVKNELDNRSRVKNWWKRIAKLCECIKGKNNFSSFNQIREKNEEKIHSGWLNEKWEKNRFSFTFPFRPNFIHSKKSACFGAKF